MERFKQDVRSAVQGLGSGVAGTIATGARALMGTVDIPVPTTVGEGNIKAAATSQVQQNVMKPFEAVSPPAPTKPYTPRYFEEGFAGAVGSSVTFLGPGFAARAAGLGMKGLQVLTGTLGASQAFGQRYTEAWEQTHDEDKAFTAGLISAAGGATEAFGGEALAMGKMLGAANRATKGALAIILESSVENAGQEAVQQVVDNLARQIYDGDAKLLDGALQAAAIGGTIGSLFGAAAAAAQRMRSGGNATAEPAQSPEKAQAQPTSIAQMVTPVETAPLSPESVGHMDAIRADPKMAALPQTEKMVEVKPSTPEQVWAQEWLNQRGMKAVFVQDSDGKALPFRGVSHRDTVYMDASLPPTEIKRRVVYHEAVHSLPGPVVNDLLAVWRKVDPKSYASLEASVAAKYPTEQVGEEAAAHNAERLVDLIAEGEVDPARLQRIINANPTLWQKFVQAIRTAAEKLGLATPDQRFPDAKVAVEYLKAFDELLKRPTVKQDWTAQQQGQEQVAPAQVQNAEVQAPQALANTDAPKVIPITPDAKFALPTDDQGRKRFDIPDESWYEKLVTAGANVEERIETIESGLGRKPHQGVTYKIDTSRGLAKQDVERVQKTVLLPITKAVAKGQIPLGQSTLGDNGKPSLGDFMRYLAAPARNAHLAGNEFTDQATGKVVKFGTEANPPSGADSLGQPITTGYANAKLEQAFKSEAGPQYRQIAELVREGNAWKLDRLVESGVQSQEWRDNVVAAYGVQDT